MTNHDEGTTILVETMRIWVALLFGTLDPDFTAEFLVDRTLDELVDGLVESTFREVQAGRPDAEPFTAADCGAVMDRLALLHLRTRYPDCQIDVPAASALATVSSGEKAKEND